MSPSTKTPPDRCPRALPEGQSATVVALVLAAATIATLPIALRLPAPPPSAGSLHVLRLVATYLLPPAVALLCFFRQTGLELTERVPLFALLVFLTRGMNELHLLFVDTGSGVFAYSNAVWQQQLHSDILTLSPQALPHSYRFLANSLIRLLEQLTGRYDDARWLYREIFVFLLLLASYHFARLYLRHRAAMLSLVLIALVYPFTILRYAGQPIDPLSHLSFVLAYICIARRQFVYLVLTLFVGSLAKETVLVMAGFYALFRRGERGWLVKSATLTALAVGAYLGVRLFVLRGMPAYEQISGVGLSHVGTNLASPHWFPLIFYTIGVFVPFAALTWTSLPRLLRQTIAYTFVTITGSSLLYSWLSETRNLVPVVIPLAVATAGWLASEFGDRPALERPVVAEVSSC